MWVTPPHQLSIQECPETSVIAGFFMPWDYYPDISPGRLHEPKKHHWIMALKKYQKKPNCPAWRYPVFAGLLSPSLPKTAASQWVTLPFAALNNLNSKPSGQFPDPDEISGPNFKKGQLKLAALFFKPYVTTQLTPFCANSALEVLIYTCKLRPCVLLTQNGGQSEQFKFFAYILSSESGRFPATNQRVT